ncbi:TPA: hypothetical protein MIH86_21765 [Klebsiella pneumoniae]|nr:hypothetical protein [Klebsiella pneumoniae]HBX8354053.1 hypothetical protein [Klebsiella pneumoniae]HBZ2505428.1 hypothetical protein [Klebsiella pneumoniae]
MASIVQNQCTEYYGNSFIETTPVGNVTVTTVMANGESVHSRSMVYPDRILASQYYGTCTAN